MTDDRSPGRMPPPPPPGGDGSSRPSGSASGWGEPTTPAQPGWQSPQPVAPQPADLGPRIGAYLLDSIGVGVVVGIPVAILWIIFAVAAGGETGGLGGGYLPGLLITLAVLAYFTVMESRDGQTFGKKLLKIRAVDAQGGVPTMQQAALRRLPFVIGSIIPTWLGGLIGFGLVIAILVTAAQDKPWNRGLHDRWAGTTVVKA